MAAPPRWRAQGANGPGRARPARTWWRGHGRPHRYRSCGRQRSPRCGNPAARAAGPRAGPRRRRRGLAGPYAGPPRGPAGRLAAGLRGMAGRVAARRRGLAGQLALLTCYLAAGVAVTWPRVTYLAGSLPSTRDAGAYVW